MAAIGLTVASAFAGFMPASAFSASAEGVEATANAFDTTAVEEDLKGVDLSAYGYDPSAVPQLINFSEYCFAKDILDCGNFGIYIYVYNPTGEKVSEREGANVLNMATEYASDSGNPSRYDNMPLVYCGATDSGLILKFRVFDDSGKILGSARKRHAKDGERRYDVAGLQIWKQGAAEPIKDYTVGYTFYFSGYSKGYGGNDGESTISCRREKLETYSVKPKFTNYRMSSPYKTTGYSETFMEVNTAYFSVPDSYYKKYGNLQKIHANWYEYVTSPIFITEDKATVEGNYSHLTDWIGKYIGEFNDDCKWEVYWETDGDYFGYSYNLKLNEIASQYEENIAVPLMAWFFYTGGTSYKEYEVTKEMVETYAQEYADNYGKEKDVLNKYSSDLFADSIDEERIAYLSDPSQKRGLMDMTIDADENHSLLSYDSTHNGFQRFWDYFFRWGEETGDERDYQPIYEVTKSDLAKGKDTFCNDLLIDTDCYSEVYDFAKTSIDKGEHPILFRYATTDFYQQNCVFDYRDNPLVSNYDGYIAQETVFLNFDLIDLTFRGDKNKETVIGCVMDPVDIFNGIKYIDGKNPTKEAEWWQVALAIAGVCIAILIVTSLIEEKTGGKRK